LEKYSFRTPLTQLHKDGETSSLADSKQRDSSMTTHKKERGFIESLKGGLSYLSKLISATIFPSLMVGAGTVMKTIDSQIIRIERRLLRNVSSILIIGFGAGLLIFALISYLKDFFGWSNAAALFSVGIIVSVLGLLLRLGNSDN
jgi:hypothetical protein